MTGGIDRGAVSAHRAPRPWSAIPLPRDIEPGRSRSESRRAGRRLSFVTCDSMRKPSLACRAEHHRTFVPCLERDWHCRCRALHRVASACGRGSKRHSHSLQEAMKQTIDKVGKGATGASVDQTGATDEPHEGEAAPGVRSQPHDATSLTAQEQKGEACANAQLTSAPVLQAAPGGDGIPAQADTETVRDLAWYQQQAGKIPVLPRCCGNSNPGRLMAGMASCRSWCRCWSKA